MPQLGETVTEGTIIRWHKAVGDDVAVDDVLFEVSTEKVDTEVPSAHAGVLRAVHVPEGDTVPVGTLLAVITETADEPLEEVPVAAPRAESSPAEAVSPAPTAADGPAAPTATRHGSDPHPRHEPAGAGPSVFDGPQRVPLPGRAGAARRARPAPRRRRRHRH